MSKQNELMIYPPFVLQAIFLQYVVQPIYAYDKVEPTFKNGC